ncbi:hypothetical protein BDF14DRAFT_1751438 [Spinellus fusiger]|nr:hypothetical protein BDF14DRAFT_1751438 [Spinellus fusiger]
MTTTNSFSLSTDPFNNNSKDNSMYILIDQGLIEFLFYPQLINYLSLNLELYLPMKKNKIKCVGSYFQRIKAKHVLSLHPS